MERGPLVTIITPSLNQVAYLPDTLRSVAAQDYGRVEHVVMDGGSTDGSLEVIREWANDHEIVWRSQPDKGQADAIAQGLALAGGEIVAWLNSDDTYLDASVISDVVDVFKRGAQVVTGAGWYIDHAGNRVDHIPVYSDRLTKAEIVRRDWLLQPATFVSRDALRRCPIDTTLHYAFDWDLFIRLVDVVPFSPIERDIAGYRLHAGSKTLSGGVRREREILRLVRRYQGPKAVAYWVLPLLIALRAAADRLPSPVRSRSLALLDRLTTRINVMTDWHGVPT
jgi:glycosyltransferase involved in cell wall biosynthesis